MAQVDFNAQSPERVIPITRGSDDDLKTVRKVEELLQRSKRATDEQRKEWIDNYRFVIDGRQWPMERPSYRFSEVINLTLAAILQEVGVQTDSRPKTEYLATEPSDVEFADILKIINDANWSKPRNKGFGWLQKVTEILMDCKISAFGVAHIPWDHDLENGIGDIGFERVEPAEFYWDPFATDLEESRWVIWAKPIPTEVLKRKYQDKAHKIKPDVQKFEGHAPDGRVAVDVDLFRLGGHLGSDKGRLYSMSDEYGGEDTTLLIRCWLRDFSLEDMELEVPDKDGNQYVQKMKYPKGRYIEIASKTILEDCANGVKIDGQEVPYEDGSFPFAILKNYAVPGKFEGLNEVTNTKGPQLIHNYVVSHTLDQMRMAANPQHVMQAGAMDDPTELTNEPGLIVEVNDISQYRREPGLGVAPGMFNLIQQTKENFDTVQGLGEVARGTPQANVTSGLQLEGFVEAAQTRPRLKNRNLDEFLQQVAYLQLSRILQFYKQPRVFRITNMEGFPEFAQFFLEETSEGMVANVSKAATRDGKVLPCENKRVPVKGMPDVKSSSGSALPFAKAQKSAESLSLFNAGAIDTEALLDAVDWPNKEAVIQRMQEAAQAQAEQEAQGAVRQ